ncbi:4Fe-4S dicluster domain-containing protein [Desulfofundulus thermobenzoicus]|uniref:4Fe-4S dicluster domain-containing protein n=1 Tax=Desulfofundulus thermobenzoicus TaxID=29376 RepID=A0A6N7IU18_9FIRM|nr:4Fe-4S dicluster domain-containing protein [Desulfofundulus thermobenzoicus]
MSDIEAVTGVVNLSEGDPGLVDEIKELGGEELLECIQCAKCAAACPMVLAGFSFFNKRVIHAILLGLRDPLLDDSSIWACQSCNRCTEVCPREVNPFEIIQAMRRVAIREFALPTLSIEGLKSLYDTGHAVYLAGAGNTRAKVGLPEKPYSTVANPKALKELQAIIRQTALADLGIIPMDESDVTDTCEV